MQRKIRYIDTWFKRGSFYTAAVDTITVKMITCFEKYLSRRSIWRKTFYTYPMSQYENRQSEPFQLSEESLAVRITQDGAGNLRNLYWANINNCIAKYYFHSRVVIPGQTKKNENGSFTPNIGKPVSTGPLITKNYSSRKTSQNEPAASMTSSRVA